MQITDYSTLIFDCDGVVLNSNKVKTQAFYDTALVFGKSAAERLVTYHVERGGISRYEKFKWFLDSLSVDEVEQGPSSVDLDALLGNYAQEVYKGLRSCDIAEGLEALREQTPNSKWLIVSGGDQAELRELFAERNIAHLFNGGIYGSPDTKETILKREFNNKNITLPAVFIGDSQYDYIATKSVDNIDFIFVSEWSEFDGYKAFFEGKPDVVIKENVYSNIIKKIKNVYSDKFS